jgi:hypothetical protein
MTVAWITFGRPTDRTGVAPAGSPGTPPKRRHLQADATGPRARRGAAAEPKKLAEALHLMMHSKHLPC